MNRSSFLILSFLLFIGVSMSAQVKYSNEFLKIGIGARAHGMGLAQVASVNDLTGVIGILPVFQDSMHHFKLE